LSVGTLRRTLLLLLAFLLQTTWIQSLRILDIAPDLVVVTLVLIALVVDPVESILMALFVGLLQDAYMPENLGLNALVNVLVVLTVGLMRSGIVVDNLGVQVAFVVAAVLLHDLIYFVGYSGVPLAEVPFFWLRYAVGRAVYSGVLALATAYALHQRHRSVPA
jgi:rod shape-determining protein MreD